MTEHVHVIPHEISYLLKLVIADGILLFEEFVHHVRHLRKQLLCHLNLILFHSAIHRFRGDLYAYSVVDVTLFYHLRFVYQLLLLEHIIEVRQYIEYPGFRVDVGMDQHVNLGMNNYIHTKEDRNLNGICTSLMYINNRETGYRSLRIFLQK